MHIRQERPSDAPAIRLVHDAAFPTGAEADLVDALRRGAKPLISLVAEEGPTIAGHILFSPVTLANGPDLKMMGLAPLAVVPALQNRGFGSALVRAGLRECMKTGIDAVVVVGHAHNNPRFGFVPGGRVGLRCEYDVPDDVFMVVELGPGVLSGVSGTVRYHPAFAAI